MRNEAGFAAAAAQLTTINYQSRKNSGQTRPPLLLGANTPYLTHSPCSPSEFSPQLDPSPQSRPVGARQT